MPPVNRPVVISPALEPLSIKEAGFVHAFLGEAQGQAPEAYKLAGYKVGSHATALSGGVRLLHRSRVARAIELRRLELARAAHLMPQDVINGLLRETAMTGEKGQASARVRAYEVLARILGMDQPKASERKPFRYVLVMQGEARPAPIQGEARELPPIPAECEMVEAESEEAGA